MLSDDELVEGFEAATLETFAHADHVRLTIIYLCRHGRGETERRMLEGLRRFATAKGDPQKFHVTMTRAWIALIESARGANANVRDATELVAACPVLLDRDALLRFYSRDRLNSDEARTGWIPPDLAPAIQIDRGSKQAAD